MTWAIRKKSYSQARRRPAAIEEQRPTPIRSGTSVSPKASCPQKDQNPLSLSVPRRLPGQNVYNPRNAV